MNNAGSWNAAIDPKGFGRVAVLYGGRSAERAVSLETGSTVLSALLEAGVDAFGLDTAAGLQAILAAEFDRAFIALHGPGGEDGAIQGVLEWMGKPYTGSGIQGSAIAMDKITTKRIWQSMNLPTPAFATLSGPAELCAFGARQGYPLMVKPTGEGSSIGMSRLDNDADADRAFADAADGNRSVFAEAWVEGAELTVGILNGKALPVIELQTPNRFYDYAAKYELNDTTYLFPGQSEPDLEQEIQELALKAAKVVGVTGWGRVDLMRDREGQCWLLEVNTIPGMTSHSLVPKAARQAGLSMPQLVLQILGAVE